MNLKEWIFTTDHKRVGVLYLIGSIAAFGVAGVMAMLMRLELSHLGPTLTDNPTQYNVWLYAHGAVMILGFQIPALTGFFANYCIPLMIGAKDVAFPRVNALSVWLFYVGIILALTTFFMELVQQECVGFPLTLITPTDPARRGSQVSYEHPHGFAVVQALIARGVIPDYREPRIMRFGFTPLYTSFEDVWNAVAILKDLLTSGSWDQPQFHQRGAVT